MALRLRVPMQLPNKLKFQCCQYLTWNRIQGMKKKAREKLSVLGSSYKGIRDKSWISKEQDTDVEKYFENLGKSLSGPYLNLLKDLTQDIPEPPSYWKFNSGWTRYTSSGSSAVKFPQEEALVFDVEVCVREGFYPTIAAAVSQKAWYLWVSSRLIRREENHPLTLTMDDLIPLGKSTTPRVIVGHFISYDRARIRENYSMADSGLRYFDTLSAHTCVSGVTNMQRNLMFSSSYDKEDWRRLTSPNSLEKISEFYCGIRLDKTTRDIFVKGTLEEISKDFHALSSYCAEDVIATHKVLCKLLPLFLERQPHPMSLAGILELSAPFIPVGKLWEEKLEKMEATACELKEQQYRLMKTRADKCLHLLKKEQFRFDPWMWDQDWKPQRWKSQLYPGWYKAFCMGCAKSLHESDGSSAMYAGLVVPKILRLRCGPYPLHYVNRLGWGVIVPMEQFVGNVNTYLQDDMPLIPLNQIANLCNDAIASINPPKIPTVSSIMELIEIDLHWRESSSTSSSPEAKEPKASASPSADTVHELLISDRCVFRRLLNVGGLRPVRNPLGINMSKSMTSFNSSVPEGEHFLEIRDELAPWLSHGSRWKTQKVVRSHSSNFGIILPMVEVCSDYLRLPRERAWSSLVSLEDNQLGAKLLHCVKAPREYLFLTATIDDLDLWLAALLSDAAHGSFGSTQFSSYFTTGVLFEKMASALMISPEEAKSLCHAVVAGADTYILSKFIYQARVNISKDEAFQQACRCMGLLLDYRLFSTSPQDFYPNINADELRTPLLGARLSRPLELEKQRVRLRAQWVIHSSKADFLHLLVACYRHLQPNARLCFVHGDNMSLYFIVKSSNCELAEEALNQAYQNVQSFCVSRLGLSSNANSYGPHLKVAFNRRLRHSE